MDALDHYFQEVSRMAKRLEEGEHFDIHLQTFTGLCADLRAQLYRCTDDPLVLDHLDQLPALDRSPPPRRWIDRLAPRSGQAMYGRYRQREKIRAQARELAARYRLIQRLLDR